MISAVIGEELGLVGILGVVGLFSMLGYAGLQTAKKAKDRYGKLLVAGLTSLILVQAIVNLFAVMGLAPLTGVPLPFVSYGNSSLLASLFAVGLILNVARGGRRRPTAPALANCASSRAGASPRVEGVVRAVPERARVVVAAGGTAGHVVPAMAVADELRASGAAVCFLGTRERIEAELVPAAGYEIDFLKVRGIDRGNPLKAAAAALEAGVAGRRGAQVRAGAGRRRRPRRRRLCRRPGGPGGDALPHAPGADRGRQPPRPRQPAARGPRSAGLPRLPDRRARGRAATSSPGAGPRRSAGRRPRRRTGSFRDPGFRPLPAGGRRQPGRTLDQRVRARRLRRAGGPRLPRRPCRRAPRLHRAEAAPGGRPAQRPLRAARVRARPRRRAGRRRPRPRPRRRLDLRGRPRPGGRRSSSPTRTRPPGIRRERGLDGASRRGKGDRGRRARPGAAARLGECALLATRTRWRRWPPPRGRWRCPTPPADRRRSAAAAAR